jgi:hypothetical protein
MREACGAVVVTVMLACAAEPFTWTKVDAQAGGGVALVETLQARVTVPSKPPDGVTVVVKLDALPAVTVAEAGVGADSEKPAPAPVTVRVTVAG